MVRIVEIILALALLAGLFFAGWSVYRTLPPAGQAQLEINDSAAKSELIIVSRDRVATGETKVELYPIDFAAVQRDFVVNGRPGRTFEDYLARQLKKLTPVHVQMDQTSRAVAHLSAGSWWLRATCAFSNGEVMEWRVPLIISERAHTIELSPENAYERTKKF